MTGLFKALPWIICTFLMGQTARSAEFSWSGDLTLFYGNRIIREQNAAVYSQVNDGVIVTGLGSKLEISSWVLDVKGRVIAGYGDSLRVPTNDPSFLDLRAPRRFFKWESTSQTYEATADIEKAYFLFQQGNFSASAGRRAVGIGTLKYLPIWNRFSSSVFHTGGPALSYNPDNIQMSYQYDIVAFSGYHVQGDIEKENMSTLVNTWYLDGLELHFLAGYWWERDTAGLAFVKDIDGLAIRAEALFFRNLLDFDQFEQQVGLGFEYALNSKISFVMEGLYSSIGAVRQEDYRPLLPRDPFALLSANSYIYGSVDYLPFAFWKFSAGALLNLVDGSSLAIGEIKYSWTDNLDLSAQMKQPIGDSGQEFGSDFYSISDDVSFGYSQQFSMQLNYYF